VEEFDMAFTTYPQTLENKAWQKAKSVLAGKTGIGEKLDELKEAHKAVDGTAFEKDGLKTKEEFEDWKKTVNPQLLAAGTFRDLLESFSKFASTKAATLKTSKTCPSKTRELVEKMGSLAHKTALDVASCMRDVSEKIKKAEKDLANGDEPHDADLVGQLKASKTSPRNFCVALGKLPGLVVAKTGITGTHRQTAKELAGGGGKLIEGTVIVEGSVYVFCIDVKPTNGTARLIKKAITLQTGQNFKVKMRGGGVDEDDDAPVVSQMPPNVGPQTTAPPKGPTGPNGPSSGPTTQPQSQPPKTTTTPPPSTAPMPTGLSPNQQNLFKLPFNHGSMDRPTAEKTLESMPVGSWLIRFSGNQNQTVVSVKLPDGKYSHLLSMPPGKDLTVPEMASGYKLDSHKLVKPGDKAPPTGTAPTGTVDPGLHIALAKVHQLIDACTKTLQTIQPPFDNEIKNLRTDMQQTLLKTNSGEVLTDFNKAKTIYLDILSRVDKLKPPLLAGKKLAVKITLKKEIFLTKKANGKNTTPFKLANDPTFISQMAVKHGLSETDVKQVLKALMDELLSETRELLPPGFVRPHGDKNTVNPLVPPQSRPKLTLEEAQAVNTYSTNAYQQINPPLWGNKVPTPPHDKTHKSLQDAFAKCKPFDTPVPVTRGMSFPPGSVTDNYLKPFKDAAGTDTLVPLTGYISTGTAGTPPDFKGNIEFVILAKQALDLQPFSAFPKEKELLLNHNTPVKVHSCKLTGSKWVVTVEQILPITN
jgi:hypothetical protein